MTALPTHTTVTRLFAAGGGAAAVACTALITVLQCLDPADSVVHGMISDLVFGPHPRLFGLAVLLLAGGALAVRTALTRVGLSGRGRLLAGFAASMAAVAAFPTCHCQVQVTASGVVHGAASLAAFVSLPVAALRLTARHRDTGGWLVGCARHTARACLGLLVPLVLCVVPVALSLPVPGPFGLLQRAVGGLVAMLVLLLAGWAWTAARRPRPVVADGTGAIAVGSAERVGVRPGADTGVEAVDGCHVLGREREVEHVDVLADPAGVDRLREDDVASLHVPAQDDLGG